MGLAVSSAERDSYPAVTPLQSVVGFNAAEEIYDELDFRDQLILDLMMCGWPQQAVAKLFGMSQGTLSVTFKGIRLKLANTTLMMKIQARQELKDSMERRSFHRGIPTDQGVTSWEDEDGN